MIPLGERTQQIAFKLSRLSVAGHGIPRSSSEVTCSLNSYLSLSFPASTYNHAADGLVAPHHLSTSYMNDCPSVMCLGKRADRAVEQETLSAFVREVVIIHLLVAVGPEGLSSADVY